MKKGFEKNTLVAPKYNILKKSSAAQARLISWSPWPPANFKIKYPAFPLVMTVLILITGKWYLSIIG